MNDREIGFRFELSPVELHWLTGIFGLTRLPAPDDPLRFIPNSTREPELQKASESLQSRGLISRAQDTGWQVDRLPAAIIQWLGSAKAMLVLDVHNRRGISHHAQIFSEENTNMIVNLENGNYQFLFLPGHNAISDYLLNHVGASFAGLKKDTEKYTLAQPVTILRAAWKDPSLAAKMLKVTGLEPQKIRPLLAWAETLDWIATLNHLQLEEEGARNEHQVLLCGNRQRCWSGDIDAKAEDKVTLTPTDMEEAHALIQNLL